MRLVCCSPIIMLLAIAAAASCNLTAPDDLSCGEALVVVEGRSDGGAVEVAGAFVGDTTASVTLVDERDNSLTVTYAIDPAAPPALPTIGPARLSIHDENCFGEGCPPGYWILRPANDGAAWFEVGHVVQLDEGDVAGGSGQRLSLQADPDSSCGDEALGAVALVQTDDGVQQLAPGDSADVQIDDAPWKAIAGAASRSSFVSDDDQCVDCAGPGLHTTWRAEIVLYAKQPATP